MLSSFFLSLALRLIFLDVPTVLEHVQGDLAMLQPSAESVLGVSESRLAQSDQDLLKPRHTALLPEVIQFSLQPPADMQKKETIVQTHPKRPQVASTEPIRTASTTNVPEPSGSLVLTPPDASATPSTSTITPPSTSEESLGSNIVTAPTIVSSATAPGTITTPSTSTTTVDPVWTAPQSVSFPTQEPSAPTTGFSECLTDTTKLPDAPTTLFSFTIPELNLFRVPIIPTDMTNRDQWFEDLKGGVGLDLSLPGNCHKTFIFGHSSNFSYVNSQYNEVFRYLKNLNAGSIIYIDREGKRYTYEVYKEEVRDPNAPDVLTDYGREELVFVTCEPYNSWAKRWVTYANPKF